MDDPVSEILGEYEFDGTAWKEFHRILQSSLAVLPSCEILPEIAFPSPGDPKDRKRAERQIFEALDQGHEGTFQAILHSIRQNEWPDLSGEEVFCLTVCLDQMVTFLEQCYVEEGERCLSLFPYSKQPQDALVMWMFWRWWIGGGLMRFVRQAAAEQSVFDRYFLRK